MALTDACRAVKQRLSAVGQKWTALKQSKPSRYIQKALSSYFFPMAVAAVSVLCYYLGWEVVNAWFIGIAGTAILLLCDDASPFYCLLLFLSVFVSVQHCPNHMGASSDFLFQTPNLVQMGIVVAVLACALVYRIAAGIVKGKVKFNATFFTLLAFCVALCLNGLFYSHYTVLNLLYGFGLSATFIAVYLFTCGNIKLDGETFKKLSSYLIALSLVISLELIIAYFTVDELIVDGAVERKKLFIGWGTYNSIGGLLVMTLPAWFYLAGKSKYGYLFLLGGLFDFAMCFLSMSRQAMLMSAVLLIPCVVWLIIITKGKQRIIDLCILGALALVMLIVAIVLRGKIINFFKSLLVSLDTGSGRTDIWLTGLTNFLRKPLFGVGFYDELAAEGVGFWQGGYEYIVPEMAHNTVIQLVSCGGAVAIFTYVIHRTRTVISYINNITSERTFAFLTMAAILLVSLLDNHIFYFLPTITYTVMVALLSKTEERQRASALPEEGCGEDKTENLTEGSEQ